MMMMMMSRASRVMPKLKGVLRVGADANLQPSSAVVARTYFQRGPPGKDIFTQMEDYAKDVERRFRRDMEGTISSIFRDFPPLLGSSRGLVPRSSEPVFGRVEDVSTENTFKLAFNFANAKPEDVKVTLKGRNLSVSSNAQTETENSKSSHSMVWEYTLPENVEVSALESSLSPEGILTVEAPLIAGKSQQASHPINVVREE